MRPPSPRPKGLFVTIVSNNPATLEALEAYLRGAGVATNSTKRLDRVIEMTPPSAAALILFPDQFRRDAVTAALAALHRERPTVLAVIVTHDPPRFHPPSQRGDSMSPLVIPKPAWAWTILDAVRARLAPA